MTPTECVDLVEWIADRCPAMKIRPGTAESWYVDLVGFEFADAMVAARNSTLDKTFIGINDLVDECKDVVQRRVGAERKARLDEEFEQETGEKRELHLGGPPPALEGPAPDVAKALVLPQRPPVPDYAPGTRSRMLQDAIGAAARERIAEQEAAAEKLARAKAEHDAKRAEAEAELEAARAKAEPA